MQTTNSQNSYDYYRRLLQCVCFFIIGPLLFHFHWVPVHILIFLWMGALIAFLHLQFYKGFQLKEVFLSPLSVKELRFVFFRFVICAILITLAIYEWYPDRLFTIPKETPYYWLTVFILYPIVSVVPQAFIYRVYFMSVYRDLFRSKWMAFALGAVFFGYMHLIFKNPVAPALTLIGGLFFLRTYSETKNFWTSVLEHALYGIFIFSVGLGEFFVHL